MAWSLDFSQLVDQVGDRHDVRVLFRHIEQVDGVRNLAAIVDAVFRDGDAEVVRERIDDRAAYATAGRAARGDDRVDAKINQMAHEGRAEERARVFLGRSE